MNMYLPNSYMEYNKSMFVVGIVGIAALIGIYAFVSITGQAIKDGKTFRVGIILPLSGNAAFYGERTQYGIEIAREKIAKEFPDLDIVVYYGDSAYVPKEGLSAYKQLKDTKEIDAVITAASHVSLAIKPSVEEDGILQMAIFSSAGDYSSLNDLSFRTSTRNEIETEAVAELIRNKGYKRIEIIYINNDFGISFKNAMKKILISQDIDILSEEAIALDTTDYRTILAKMQNEEPDAIFMVGLASQYSEIIKQAHELGIETQFLTMRSAEDPILIRNAGELANGLIYTYPFDATSQTKEIREFSNSFEKKYGTIPDAYAAEGYEGFRLVAYAFEVCSKDYLCVKNYLTNLKDYDSVLGKLSFDENGDVYYDFFVKTVRNGEFVRLD